MDVRVGHFSDPDSIPGLAHFLGEILMMLLMLMLTLRRGVGQQCMDQDGDWH